MLVRAAMPYLKSSDMSEIPAAIMNVLLDIPDWNGIRERLQNPTTSEKSRN